ncbi:MAG TPA: hypothetical protein PK926_00400 [Spirochaetota bacterium]|nr:hypothetical protein [Spirochaetota bacterium]HPI87811.1 hypothetical protein [Spirochaetota bacterium]HPR47538.1 hypothetical protein [Spirochaetota bacterium]
MENNNIKSFKNWSEAKIHALKRMYPFYDRQRLAKIMNCSTQDIDEFEKHFFAKEEINK